MIKRVLIFLVLNFSALAIGGVFTGEGVPSSWYQTMNKAPWTPPGWIFGAAWTTIMICFAVYMAYVLERINSKKSIIILFSIQWVLNVAWNPAFFYFQNTLAGLIIIVALTGLIGYILFSHIKDLSINSFWLLPYFVWLIIATSLNGYAWLYN
jgi:tryptophan-rich sensory protein